MTTDSPPAPLPGFPDALRAWRSEAFARVLKDEIEGMAVATLPLHEGCTRGGLVGDTDITATVFESVDEGPAILVEVGIFFTERVAGCSCADEPDAVNTYCRLRIRIDKASAAAAIHVVPD